MISALPASNAQEDLFEVESTRALLDTLLSDSRLYHSSADYKALLDFVVRLRNFAPFNAMLLQVQKPGLTYAASATEWWTRFGRKPKQGARPLLILWPFGPVALVYDVADTQGKELPQDVAAFIAHGPIGETAIEVFRHRINKKSIFWDDLDAGDGKAGSIRMRIEPLVTNAEPFRSIPEDQFKVWLAYKSRPSCIQHHYECQASGRLRRHWLSRAAHGAAASLIKSGERA
jgi:hypothetical protein